MCGILAISSSKIEKFQIEKALDSIGHRGPDDKGIFVSTTYDAQLGHVRLAIIDLSPAGHQPMDDISARYTMVFNGEIYNYLILRKDLEQQYGNIQWRSTSDSEVILEGFARQGYTFLGKLNGIFTLAIYDRQEKILHVLRDPIGIKPLYYTEQQGSFFFCSEVKGLLAFPNVKATLRAQSLADQLSLMYVPEPFTMYEEIFKVEAGVYFAYREGKEIARVTLFTELTQPISFSSENEMIERLRETFSASVKRQLIADVPVSLFLSGGLDSSAIAYEAVKSGGNIKTAYTISFTKQDNKYDGQSSDLYYAEKIAKQLNLNLQVIEARPEFISLLPDLIPFLEDGISDPSAINTYLICKSAREDGVKVMLSGQGADEYLCGYRRYRAEKAIEDMSSLTRKTLSAMGSLLPVSVPGKLNAQFRRIKRLSLAAGQDAKDRVPGYFMWGSGNEISELFLDKTSVRPAKDLYNFFAEHSNEDTLSAMLKADQRFDLMSLNLSYTDKMSMRVGVEARVPFLDLEMIRLMNAIPLNMKLRGKEQKYILKKAMEPYLPHEIIYRQKAGFALPLRSWFKNKNETVAKYFDRERIRKQGIFDDAVIDKMLGEQFTGVKDHSYCLFAMLCQQVWLEKIM